MFNPKTVIVMDTNVEQPKPLTAQLQEIEEARRKSDDFLARLIAVRELEMERAMLERRFRHGLN